MDDLRTEKAETFDQCLLCRTGSSLYTFRTPGKVLDILHCSVVPCSV